MMGLLRTIYYNLKLKRNLKKSREKIKEDQKEKLRKILLHAFDNSPYYHNMYRREGLSREDLKEIPVDKIPPVNKEMIMDNLEEVITVSGVGRQQIEKFLEKNPAPASFMADKYKVLHTSGSTGRLGYFIYNKREWDFIKAISLRMFDYFSLRPGRYAFIGASDGHYAGISLFLSPINQLEEYFYDEYLIININHPLTDYIHRLNELQPHNLTGYPSAVRILAEMQRAGRIDISPQTIICGGEPFSPRDKDYIKKTWGIEPVNYYASSESLMLGISPWGAEDIYLMEDANYIEIKENKTIITNLYNFTQPLIRYEISDVLTPSEKRKGKIDWPFSRVKDIIGRREETLWFINYKGKKEFIHPIVLVEFFVRGLKKFQVIQIDERSFNFLAVKTDEFTRDQVKQRIKNRLDDLLSAKNLDNVEYKVIFTDDILPDPETGKYKLIKSKKI